MLLWGCTRVICRGKNRWTHEQIISYHTCKVKLCGLNLSSATQFSSAHWKYCCDAQKYTVFEETDCIFSRASAATNSHDSRSHARERHKISSVSALASDWDHSESSEILQDDAADIAKSEKICSCLGCGCSACRRSVTLRSCSALPGSEQFFSSVSLSCDVAISRLPQRSTTGRPSTVIPWPAKHNSKQFRQLSRRYKKRPEWPRTGTTLMAVFHDPKTSMAPAIRH